MPKWYVISPEFEVTIPILDYGEGPREPCRDVLIIEADTKRQALVKAVRQLRADARRGERNWLDWIGYGANPFKGLKAEPFMPDDYDPEGPADGD